jgi:hypothetical protein
MYISGLNAFSKNRILFAAWLIGFLVGTLGICPAAEDGKRQELNRALADIRTAEQMINQRAALAEEVRRMLGQQVDGLKTEIHLERRRTGAVSFAQARQISRIDYNLRLVQRLLGYIDCLDNRIGYFRSAGHSLEFYRQQIRDDLLILRTLQDVDTAGLMERLAADIAQFKHQSEKPLLSAATSGLRPLEAIWGELLQSK